MLSSPRSYFLFAGMLLVLVGLGAVAMFFILWAGAIIVNDVHQHVTPWSDRGEIFIWLALGVISMMVFLKAFLYELRVSSRTNADISRYQMPLDKPSLYDREESQPFSELALRKETFKVWLVAVVVAKRPSFPRCIPDQQLGDKFPTNTPSGKEVYESRDPRGSSFVK